MKATSLTLRFSAVAASIGLLSFGVAAAVGSFSRADARGLGPEVTGGTHPYVTITGTTASGTTNVYTVPSDRILIVTGATMNSTASLYQGATLKVHGGSYAMYSSGTNPGGAMLVVGNGHVVFDPGSTVAIAGSTGYFIQGYLAHP